MSLPDSPIRDPLEGELAEPPPSDLSEYTWDESETEFYEPAHREGAPSAPAQTSRTDLGPQGQDARRFADILIKNHLVGDSEIRTVWDSSSLRETPETPIALPPS